ncbi:UNVERIFIED_CONTAM: hypothetical protein Scaly_0043500 [Sesamum calycinum]|uniref:Retrotransposon gag domain-containing protein n=1 Tax=Sesamum calycinum TaxID=2727403 RepID=A0AAW2SWL5_9LAMI
MELRHDSLAAAVSDIQQHLTAIPSPVTSFSSPAALPPLPPPIPVSQRLDVISFYMKGEALSWFKWMFTNRQLSSWDAFARALKLRFGPSSFDNHQAVLFKLRQRGSVAEFQADFERNHVVGLPPEALLNCFISRLRPDIQRELAVLQQSSLSQAFGLAHLVESKLFDNRTSRPLRHRAPQLYWLPRLLRL